MKKIVLFFVFLIAIFSVINVRANCSTLQSSTNSSVDDSVTIIKGCPNPSNGIFAAQIENAAETFTVLVYSTLGEKIFEKTYSRNEKMIVTIDISSFKKGMYFLTYKDSGQIVRSKILTQ